MPIRADMSASNRKALVPSLAASLVLTTPAAVVGQSVSSRPAAVALTVVVPPRALSELATVEHATLFGGNDTARDVHAVIGVANRQPSRIEVRLGADWSDASTRVFVRNRAGEFELLASTTPIVAATTPAASTNGRSRLQFRLESERPMAAGMSIPVEYRVTIGEGDEIAVWTFPSLLQSGGKP